MDLLATGTGVARNRKFKAISDVPEVACGIFKNVEYTVELSEKIKQKSKKVVVPILTQSCQDHLCEEPDICRSDFGCRLSRFDFLSSSRLRQQVALTGRRGPVTLAGARVLRFDF